MKTQAKRAVTPPPHDHRSMMQAPTDWPKWPWLPLKRPVAGQSWPELALLHADHTGQDGAFPIYPGANLFTVGWFPAPEMPTKMYDSVDKLLADGWIVD